MDEYDEENIKKLVKNVKNHSSFVSDQENFDIDGIPDRIKRDLEKGDEHSLKKEVEKLKEVANQHSDYELERLASKMKRSLQ